jgi:chromosome segregation protein
LLDDVDRSYEQEVALPNEMSSRRRALEAKAASLNIGLSVDGISKEAINTRQRIQQVEAALNVLESSRALIRITELEREKESKQGQLKREQLALDNFRAAHIKAKTIANTIRRISGEIVDERLAGLSPLLSELYMRLRPHGEWTKIQYLMRGDVKRFLSFEVGEGMNPRFVFSSGQRRALALAFLLAVHLSRTWTTLDTLVLDDPIQHIDDYRALHLTETLASIRQSGRQVICMVENSDLADLLCRRLRAESGGEGLRIEMDFSPGKGAVISKLTQVQTMEPRVLLTA